MTVSRTRAGRAAPALIPVLAASLAAGALLAPVPAAAAPLAEGAAVAINEVESDGPAEDWVELSNPGTAPADISGWTLVDDKDEEGRGYVLPAGTVVNPGEFAVIGEFDETTGLGFDFGLGKADHVRLFDDAGTLVDDVQYTEPAAVTLGRCPDGTGAFRNTTSSTPGEANDCRPPLVINEVTSTGDFGDFVELANTSAETVDASGLRLLDSDDGHVYSLPAGTTIAPGEFFLIAQLDEEAGTVGFDFGLGKDDSVRLQTADGQAIDEFAWTAHPDFSYGRCVDVTGDFAQTTAATPGDANSCEAVTGQDTVVVNETVSTNGIPGDWIELFNTGTATVDLSGWLIRDNDDNRSYTIPAGTEIAAGSVLVVEEAQLDFGLGKEDIARLYTPDGALVDSLAWSGHAETSNARCPDGTGEPVVSTSATKGAPNDCSAPVRINEVESDSETTGDWIELVNVSAEPVNLEGFILRDDKDDSEYVFPTGTQVSGNGHLLVNELDEEAGTAGFDFGLGKADTARLYDAAGTLLDSTTWDGHAATTWGRCPDGNGPFAVTAEPTYGAANDCEGDLDIGGWPGDGIVTPANVQGSIPEDLSGLDVQVVDGAPVLWAAVDDGFLHRLTLDADGNWAPSAAFPQGQTLLFPGSQDRPDAEGITVDADGTVYVGTERDKTNEDTTRNSVARYDYAETGELEATLEWNLTEALPAVYPNYGLEAVEWVPDSALAHLVDSATGATYNPADYPLHGTGLFFVGLEGAGNVDATTPLGEVYAFALNSDGTFNLVATLQTGLGGVMALDHDTVTNTLWVVCDEGCEGTSAQIDLSSEALSTVTYVARPAGMPNLNNEGFATAPTGLLCADGARPAWFAVDGEVEGHSIRATTLPCAVAEVSGPGDDSDDNGNVVGTGTDDKGADDVAVPSAVVDQDDVLADDDRKHGPLASTGSTAVLVGGVALLLVLAGVALMRIRRHTA